MLNPLPELAPHVGRDLDVADTVIPESVVSQEVSCHNGIRILSRTIKMCILLQVAWGVSKALNWPPPFFWFSNTPMVMAWAIPASESRAATFIVASL